MMIEKIGEPAMLEQLAEEAAELSHAALKLARIIRGENPTPVTEVEAWDAKAQRFRERWVEKTDSSKESFGDSNTERP